eukprot:19073-Heterococcus_DN1.PRE.2
MLALLSLQCPEPGDVCVALLLGLLCCTMRMLGSSVLSLSLASSSRCELVVWLVRAALVLLCCCSSSSSSSLMCVSSNQCSTTDRLSVIEIAAKLQ